MNEPRLLVSGATGFLGRQILRAAHGRRIPAAALVRNRQQWESLPWRGEVGEVAVLEAPLEAATSLQPALRGIQTIVHSAGIVQHTRRSPEAMLEFNVGSTLQMVRSAQRLGARLVFVSSSGTVGCFRRPEATANEDAPYAESIVSRWPYYLSKIRAEVEARQLAEQLGVELVIVRPPVLLGPHDHRRRSTGYVQKVLDRKIPMVPSGGMHFTDVRDVASALVSLCELPAPKPTYHLPGRASSLGQFIRDVADVSGVSLTQRPLPRRAALCLARVASAAPRRPHWLPDPVVLEMSTHYWGLSSRFAHELGYAARPPRQTLTDTVAWLRSDAP